ncbi:two-component system response regulator LytT [Breznakia sp. PF5-3]|uniref:LytR/AlgR family response regulator transcription factor n=1 Tax=unclassified Breznakia TaxID=2623764 RepID=UPI002405D1DF|nr:MULTISPECIES: LytTR family DNA-binding domain-containing protein [unclassified Breznakia]MDF9823784.1 two-component system response regulator LytT [Breznakia sp. PM6-1]MDF9834650.1 two-component system response regulator LytT [Breznakia sp. PF5-3]MDF9836733.1 two-component system response regulator LytT [Breznakia sp. PFB2-8]MDF9858818.1 two-component system response regulator LytT [Breznakia sp. PH5-24]
MNVCILEDAKKDIIELQKCLENYAQRNQFQLQIDVFYNANNLSEILNRNYDLIFLDIYLNEDNGIEVAKKIREYQDVAIVFLTSSKDFALEAFQVQALHYILKPIDEAQIEEVFQRYSAYPHKAKEFIKVKVGHSDISIPVDDILYIEKDLKAALIHTNQECIRSYSTLEMLYEQLNHSLFTRPQRSFIVNYGYIKEIKTNIIILKNKVEISMSRKIRSEIKNGYYEYKFKKVRSDGNAN